MTTKLTNVSADARKGIHGSQLTLILIYLCPPHLNVRIGKLES